MGEMLHVTHFFLWHSYWDSGSVWWALRGLFWVVSIARGFPGSCTFCGMPPVTVNTDSFKGIGFQRSFSLEIKRVLP